MLVVEQLSFAFPDRVILDRASFKLRPAAITCLLGGNGSGKTTLFNIITGFLRPDTGSIQFDGTELSDCAPFRISRLGLTRTFQDLRLIGKLTVRDNIILALPGHPREHLTRALLPPRFHRERDAAEHRKVDVLLADYFLTEVADQPASEISYGQQKLLNLACCAAMDARLILLDEPVAGINPEYRHRMTSVLSSLKKVGKTILMIEHNPEFIESVSDHCLFLHAGRILEFPSFAALRSDTNVHEAYF